MAATLRLGSAPCVQARIDTVLRPTVSPQGSLWGSSLKPRQSKVEQQQRWLQQAAAATALAPVAAAVPPPPRGEPLPASVGSSSGSTPAPAAAAGGGGGNDVFGDEAAAHERHKELNRTICSAASATALLQLIEAQLPEFNHVNCVSAFHRLAKHTGRAPPAERQLVRTHPATHALCTVLEAHAGPWSGLQLANVLWGHSTLGHASLALLMRVLRCLEDPWLHPAPSDSVLITYSLAKLGSKQQGFQRRVAAALLADLPPEPQEQQGQEDSGAGEESGAAATAASPADGPEQRAPATAAAVPGQQQQQPQQLAWWQQQPPQKQPEQGQGQQRQGRQQGAEEGDAAATAAAAAAARQSSAEDGDAAGGPVLLQAQQGQRHHPASAFTSRELCLLAWSLSEGEIAGQQLLRGLGSEVARRGVGDLSVQSMCQLLTALGRAGVAHDRLMDAVALEVARRHPLPGYVRGRRGPPPQQQPRGRGRGQQQWQQQEGQQQQQQGWEPPALNEQDLANLAHSAAATWQRQLAAAGADPGDRLAWPRAVSAHLRAFPPRRALLSLLARRAGVLAPNMGLRALCSLTWALAALGGEGASTPLLGALALRAQALSPRLDAQAVAGLAWAYATLAYDAPALYDCLADAAVRLLAAPPSPQQFTPQSISMVVFAFGAANRADSPAARRMLPPLCERAQALLPQLTPQGLCNLGWGLAVAAHYPPQLLRGWRAAVGAHKGAFSVPELNQLHLVEVALRLEAPAVGLEVPSAVAPFFDSLYQAGRVRISARAGWDAHKERGPRTITRYQLQVYEAVLSLGVECELEHSEGGEYSIDIALPRQRIAIEADGPVHFTANSRHLLGATALKRRLLARRGWAAVGVPYFEWDAARAPGARVQLMRTKLAAAGLVLPPQQQPSAGAGTGTQPTDSAAQPQAQPSTAAAAGGAAAAAAWEQSTMQLAAATQAPATEAAAAPGPAAPAVAGGVTTSPAASSSSSGGGDAGDSSAAAVQQRASRLASLQFGQGWLSRQALLARGAALGAAKQRIQEQQQKAQQEQEQQQRPDKGGAQQQQEEEDEGALADAPEA